MNAAASCPVSNARCITSPVRRRYGAEGMSLRALAGKYGTTAPTVRRVLGVVETRP